MAAIIREATVQDAEAILAIYTPYVLETPISFEEEPPSLQELRRRMQSGYPWFVATHEDEVIGYAYGSQHRARPAYRWSVEVTVYTTPKSHRTGVGRQLYTALFQRLAELGFCTAFAGVTLPNEASVGFHEAMGFQSIGVFRNIGFKLGRWHDVAWFQRPLRDLPSRTEELKL